MEGAGVSINVRCAQCLAQFELIDQDRRFLRKCCVPPPTHCPACRQQRRLAFNNEMNLYWRECDFTGDRILSTISPDKPYLVYKPEVWWGDKWDALSYGREFEFTQSFFEQYQELCLAIPHLALQSNYLLDENSAFTNYAGNNKNCYLIFHADLNRDCYYGYGVKKCESCVDVYNVFDCELLYQCIDCRNCYNLSYSQDCFNCSDSYFLRDCIGCKNCLGCRNLHQKEFYIFNQPHTKAEYFKAISEFRLTSRSSVDALDRRFVEFCQTLPGRFLRMINVENSLGDHLSNCRDVTESFDVADMRDGRYCFQVYNGASDCMDLYQFGLKAELVYEGSIIGYNAQMIRFCHKCNEQVRDLTYCQDCYHCHDLFGCFGLRHKSYCILNKQYSESDYRKLLERIVRQMTERGEWGEFFPMSLSPFAYNETTAQEYFPLAQTEAEKRGLLWKDRVGEDPELSTGSISPDTIGENDELISKAIYACITSKRSYRIIQPELAFFRKQGIPLPQKCFIERHRERIKRRNPRLLRQTKCAHCQTSITTAYPDGPGEIRCERCYLAAMI